jgi:hypothetical protein
MKNVKVATARQIKVQFNSVAKQDWARIRDAKTNEILHTGRVPYIVKVAKDRYNKSVAV